MNHSSTVRAFWTCLALAACGALSASAAAPGAAAPTPEVFYATVTIDGIGPARLASLHAEPGFRWWVEVDEQLLVLTDEDTAAAVGRRFDLRRLDLPVVPRRLRLVARGHRHDLAAMAVDVLVQGGRHAVVQARHDGEIALPDHGHGESHAHVDLQLLPFRAGTVLARQVANEPPRRLRVDPAIDALVAEVDVQRWFADLQALTGFNRWTFSPGILDARDWLVARFAALPGLLVETTTFDVEGTPAHNVIATLPGTVRPDDWYIVGAHYDARGANDSDSAAASPGAEDNATGCAAVLELARILAAHPPAATVLFVCFSGEEQGLWGSRDHVADLDAAGQLERVRGVLNMDMISYTVDADLDAILGSRPQHPEILERFVAAAGAYTSLRIVTSLTICCSDHMPYLDAGLPAVVAASNDWSQYPHYHQSSDTAPNVSLVQGEQILRMNVAALAAMAGAGAAPIFADGFEAGGFDAWELP